MSDLPLLGLLEAKTRAELALATARALRSATHARTAYVAMLHGEHALEVLAIDGEASGVAPVGSLLRDGSEHGALGREGAHAVTERALAGARIAHHGVVVPIDGHGVAVAITDRAPARTTLEAANAVGAATLVALRHLRANDETRALMRRLQALLELQRTLGSGVLEDAFPSFATRLGAEVPFELAWVAAIQHGQAQGASRSDSLEILASHGEDAATFKPGIVRPVRSDEPSDALGAALRDAKARAGAPTFLASHDAARIAAWARSGTIVPLVAHDAIVGVLCLLSGAAPSALPADSTWLLAAVAEPLAMAVQNANLVGRLRSAMRDWQATFDAMDAMVLVADDAGSVRRANWALARRLGSTPNALVGREVGALFPGQALPTVATARSPLVGPRGEPLRASAVALPGGGTVVVIQEARTSSGASSTMPALRRYGTGPQNGLRGRVLIVDDEPNILRAVSRTIARSHEVVTATDGDEALELIRRDPRGFDAVMTDVQMPRMSGVELYRAIERDFPELTERVLFMTGGVFAAEVEAFLRSVAHRVLRKPFDPDLLRRLVDERVALSRVA